MGFFKKLAASAMDEVKKNVAEALKNVAEELEKPDADKTQQKAPKPTTPAASEKERAEQESSVAEEEKEEVCVEIPEGECVIDNQTLYRYITGNETKIILPSTLCGIVGSVFPEHVTCIDFSKVDELEVIEEDTFYELKDIEEIILPEGVTEISGYAFCSCPNLKRIVLPSTIKELDEHITEKCPALEIIDMSKVDKLSCMPGYLINDCQIKRFVLPKNLTECEEFPIQSHSLREIYVPASMRDFNVLYDPRVLDDPKAKVDIYCYAPTIEDITDFFEAKDNLYVLPEHYEGYKDAIKELVDDGYDEDEFPTLLVMPEEKRDFYSQKNYYADLVSKKESQPTKDQEALPVKTIGSVAEHTKEKETDSMLANSSADSTTTEFGLFSKELEELINAAVEGGELTDKKREIVMRRAAKEGADLDEVEMLLEARLYEQQNQS